MFSIKSSFQRLFVIISWCLFCTWIVSRTVDIYRPKFLNTHFNNQVDIPLDSYKYNTTTNLSTLYGIYFKNNIETFRKEYASKSFKTGLTLVLQQLQISSIFITDVGANRGQMFDFQWINNATTNASFLLIEPDPRIFDTLDTRCSNETDKYSAKLQSFQCNILSYALTSSYVANKSMVFRVNKHDSQLSGLIDPKIRRYRNRKRNWKDTKVDIATFDWIINNKINVSFTEFNMLKIDTEGYDASVMLGASESISNFDVILWECSYAQLVERGGPGTSHYSTVKYLETFSFDCYKLGTKMAIPLNLKYYNVIYDTPEFMNWHNCVAINQKSKYYCPIKNILCEECQNDTYSLCSYHVCEQCNTVYQ